MVKELEELGIKPIVSIWPTINEGSENFQEMNERNLLLRTDNGQYGLFNFCGMNTYIDPSNPETREFMWSKVKENYYQMGIKNFWLDEAEPEIHPTQFDNVRFHLGNGEEVALVYPYYYASFSMKACRSRERKRSFLWHGLPGSEVSVTVHWYGMEMFRPPLMH